ncbi:sensor histidine kinase NtrY-like [Poseidonocella sedimentorum]|uniref:histidine kinase n=1 Tax=Poseidonocella sedimentorum TaxID=871652 RepID=A0A1I6E7Y6_9RHOB|nr:PAS domain-containing sensor histidine kinase [Poseidonocella sedimentorum]SFR13845.1 two-component system, NtrC family, nitrogen regulation sensor histidine kinase NtrY [Poseidonocella sedimentorum]
MTRLARRRRVRNATTLGLVLLGPALALATFLVLGPLELGETSTGLRLVILADLVYVITIATLIFQRVVRSFARQRARGASNSKLHQRLMRVFALLALLPTVTVAIFAVITVNFGLEGWFSERVRNVVGASLAAAQAYEAQQREDLLEDAQALAGFLNANRRANFFMADGNVRQVLAQGQSQIQRGLREAYVIDASGEIKARGERSYLFDYEQPDGARFAQADEDGAAIIEDWDNNEFRALVPLEAFVDRYLYVSRTVDGELLSLLDDTRETVSLYQQLESERGRLLFEFGLLYLGFSLMLILAAIWLGLWFAARLANPVSQLAGAARAVGAGDLDVRVPRPDGDDELAMLGRTFNTMTAELKRQREELLNNTRQIERRRRLFDSVLSSVTSGVVGVDPEGRITLVNRSAGRLLQFDGGPETQALQVAVPEFAPLFAELCEGQKDAVQREIKVTRAGRLENLLVRMSTRRNEEGGLEGYVVAFDDVTDLVSAQRMAAWGDVARRIAHEIKNPLTPIQLSAERIRRKFAPKLAEDAETLEEMTDVIVRQTGDLRRIVDEFSRFARMPAPERHTVALDQILREVVLLQQTGLPDIRISADLPEGPILAELDDTMMRQALTNLIKNGGEAIETFREQGAPEGFDPEIRVALRQDGPVLEITIADNGVGLPEDRAKLFEPYVTTRASGTGLGLPIVRKIVEEHGGTLALDDAAPFTPGAHSGACATIRLGAADPAASEPEDDTTTKTRRYEDA